MHGKSRFQGFLLGRLAWYGWVCACKCVCACFKGSGDCLIIAYYCSVQLFKGIFTCLMYNDDSNMEMQTETKALSYAKSKRQGVTEVQYIEGA